MTRVPSLAHRARLEEDGAVKDDRRYTLTTDGFMVLASETGVLEIERVAC